MAIYLGFDASTQSLTVVAIEVDGARRRVVLERSLEFDETLPEYGTRRGVLPDEDPRAAASPPLMWADALDRMMAEVAASGIELAQIAAISGAAQQHGSVYLASGSGARLGRLDPAYPLRDQLRTLFTRDRSPIWMDSTTAADCAAMTRALGGPAALARLTGSRAFERFTGPQIRRFAREQPSAYAATERIHLVSSFLASLLAGGHAPVEPGDAAGMNLMDITARRWSPAALAATADRLELRLPELRDSSSIVGGLAAYWQRRYGFPPALIVAWSGDNPCSLIGVGLVREGRAAVWLGTSDTIFAFMDVPRIDPSGTGHVFGAPCGGYMGLTCFRNGSLARQRVRDAYGLDWAGFSAALDRTPPGNRGAIMLPWFEPEITPPVPQPNVRRFGLDPGDAAANVRAVVEAQMMAIAHHSAWMGVRFETIHATGGAAANRAILQVLADVLGATVQPLEIAHSAALGAALRAWHACERARGRDRPWEDIVEAFVKPASTAVSPRAGHRPVYAALLERYVAHERQALAEASAIASIDVVADRGEEAGGPHR